MGGLQTTESMTVHLARLSPSNFCFTWEAISSPLPLLPWDTLAEAVPLYQAEE